MSAPGWFSQSYPPEGASAAEGIRKQLGSPELDLLTTLVRESAQNSWDARISDDVTVDYRIELRTIGAAHAYAWQEQLLRDAPLDANLPLRGSLKRPILRVLSISDRGTRGLGGPTRADTVTDESRDFVSFLRNIGEPRDKGLGGGTYGFGKGILYLVSTPGVILVHTRCEFEGRRETRLMGAALWESYVAKEPGGDRRYTGRHWWGDRSGGVVEPLVGREADVMARRLGLTPFAEADTGTTIYLINPKLEEKEPAEAARYLAETIAWQLWPKMLEHDSGHVPMRFSVGCDGIEYEVPDPALTRPLHLFVEAYRKMTGPEGKELYCGNPRKLLGRLGLEKRPTPTFESTTASEMAGVKRLVHHVCLMRPAELVVTYWPGPETSHELISYAGVFRADPDMDETYAKAEPPTHDSWNPQFLESPEITFVRTTFRRLKERIDEMLGRAVGTAKGAAHVSLGAASDGLSPLIGGAWGIGGATDYGRPGGTVSKPPRSNPKKPGGNSSGDDGAGSGGSGTGGTGGGTTPGGGGSVPRPRRPRVKYLEDPYLDEYLGNAVLVQEFQLPVSVVQRVSAELSVALAADGGRETDPPVGADMPGLVGWQDEQGILHRSPTYVIEGGDDTVWKAIVKPAADTMTEIVIRAQAVGS